MGKVILGIVAALIVSIVLAVVFLVFVPTDFWQKASYIATVVVAFFACGLLIVTTGLVAAVLGLISILNGLIDKKINPLLERVSPLLDKANETVDTAKGTVTYVGEGVVSPLIKVSSILAAVRGGVSALFRRPNE